MLQLPLKVLSPHLYVFTSLFSLEFSSLSFHCLADESIPVSIGSQSSQLCYLQSGQQVLDLFHIPADDDSSSGYWLSMLYVTLLFIGYRLLALAGTQDEGETGLERRRGGRRGQAGRQVRLQQVLGLVQEQGVVRLSSVSAVLSLTELAELILEVQQLLAVGACADGVAAAVHVHVAHRADTAMQRE